jgi:hypothetical protein
MKRLGDGPNQEEDDMVFIDQTLLNYEKEKKDKKKDKLNINKQNTKFSI